jgi:hypothetical protein
MRKLLYLAASLLLTVAALPGANRWTAERAREWHSKQGWLVGANYIPSNAINQLEMWQADSFDPQRIDLELGWAKSVGMNTMRVFLHDLLWQQNPRGFKKRIDAFLRMSERHGIRPMFVLFDSCWDPVPRLGKQRAPRPGVHNSGWVQGPGAEALANPEQEARLEAYVRGVVGEFAKDKRVLAWDIWNEPDNLNTSSYGPQEPSNKRELVAALLPKAFRWARAARPTQPLTSGVWQDDWSSEDKWSPIARIQLENSDVISFHSYDPPAEFEKRVAWLTRLGRPLLCTEYMARPAGSTFEAILPLAKARDIAAYNWGLVVGKTQTNLPWDSWKSPYVNRQPPVWFHEVFQEDGTPYKPEEAEFLRKITYRQPAKSRKK